jgi:hypothetical protein
MHFNDIYAPCIVGHTQWNDKADLLQYCGKGATLFNEYTLSISDEAFPYLCCVTIHQCGWCLNSNVSKQGQSKQESTYRGTSLRCLTHYVLTRVAMIIDMDGCKPTWVLWMTQGTGDRKGIELRNIMNASKQCCMFTRCNLQQRIINCVCGTSMSCENQPALCKFTKVQNNPSRWHGDYWLIWRRRRLRRMRSTFVV